MICSAAITMVLFIVSISIIMNLFTWKSPSSMLKKILTTGLLCLNLLIANSQTRTVQSIPTPDEYERQNTRGFGAFLRGFPLKPKGSTVHLYDGTEKYWQDGAYAILNIDTGTTDLQQCADAVIRLYAEYQYKNKNYTNIHFNFTNGFRADYIKWAEGYRIKVVGNNVSWIKTCDADYSYNTFRKYLNVVFMYAGTASLSRELVSVPLTDVQVGDVFIYGGFPGHAMLVVDVAKNKNGSKAILVAQSYMPAQDIHLVTNLSNPEINPWYIIDSTTENIYFPEWSFQKNELKRFK